MQKCNEAKHQTHTTPFIAGQAMAHWDFGRAADYFIHHRAPYL
jgi:hypothetical protein